jgi:hypothetical protein
MRILKGFKSRVLKMRILKGLRACFSEMRILKSLAIRADAKTKTPAGMLALRHLGTILPTRYYTAGDTFRQGKTEEVSLAHDMSALLAREMSAFQRRPRVNRSPGGCRDEVHQGRDGAGDEGAGSDFAGDQQADSLV